MSSGQQTPQRNDSSANSSLAFAGPTAPNNSMAVPNGSSPSHMPLQASFASRGATPFDHAVPNNSLVCGAGAPLMTTEGVVVSANASHRGSIVGSYGYFTGGESPAVPNTSMVAGASPHHRVSGGATPSRNFDSLASSCEANAPLAPNNSIATTAASGGGSAVTSPMLGRGRTSSGGGSAVESPLMVPNNSIVANLMSAAASSSFNPNQQQRVRQGSSVESMEGLVPNNSLAALPKDGSTSNTPVVEAAALADELRRTSPLYGCFARPPSRSVDTTEVEQCFASFEPQGKPLAVHWHRVVAALGPQERARHGTMFPQGTSLDIQKFMDFVETVSRNR